MAGGNISGALADFVVGPIISVRFAAGSETVAWVAVVVVLPSLAGAAVELGVALANWVGGPFVVRAASSSWVALAERVQWVDVLGAALLFAIANTERVRQPGVAEHGAAFRSLIALTVVVGQVVVILAALLSWVAHAVRVVEPSVTVCRIARSAELAVIIHAWAAFLSRIAFRASRVFNPSLARAASSSLVASAVGV